MTEQHAFRLLFYRTGDTGLPVPPTDKFIRCVEQLLNAEDIVDKLNALAHDVDAEGFTSRFLGEIFNSFVSCGVLPENLRKPFSANTDFLLSQAAMLCRKLQELRENLTETEISSLLPSAMEIFDNIKNLDDIDTLAEKLLSADPFCAGRIFSWKNGRFHPAAPSSVKSVDKFFGFPGVRAAFAEHFANFSRERTSLPLLINSLPGYGKTSMVISYALSVPNTTVILADPEALSEKWRELIDALSVRQDKKFVLFFDDIDPREINWYLFRTNVGGAFTPPANIMPVLTANYEFHPSILSRGRRITYPVFDEERCLEMIEDFLGTYGMKNPPRNIVSLMGAGYTEDFGQKKFTELSPRTLMRYLAIYEKDQFRRKQIVELAGGGMITRPDAELFYEFNIGLMRSMYGEEYIQNLLKERLKAL